MPELPNYYEVLGVRPTDDAATLKRAYYERMRRYHPDNFLAERKRLEIVGDKLALRRLDKTIQDAGKQTQVINAAYSILSDPERRTHYDWLRTSRSRSPETADSSVSPDDAYDLRRHRRPHSRATTSGRQPAAPRPERFPTVLAIGFLIVLALGTSFLSNFFVGPPGRPRNSMPPTVNIPAGSMDATAGAARRTPTPRTPQSYLTSGDALYKAQLYENAVTEYTHAIEGHLMTAEIYFKRGRAYAADEDLDKALIDLNRAEEIDAALPDLYRERGLVYFRLWQSSNHDNDAASARRDLAEYAQRGGDMSLPEVIEAQSALDD